MMKIYNIIFPFLMLSTPLFAITGYVRYTETSFCMDSCSIYYLEDEYGEFLSWISHLDDFEMLNDYNDRFVDIEGDTVQCVECEAINVTSIAISDECQMPVYCFVDPCLVSECSSYPDAECVANYCGGCWADYYLNGELLHCDSATDCVDLTEIDFGACDMVLGIGWVNDNCVYVSGCDWVADSVDYTNAFFNSMDDCIETCVLVSNDESKQLPTAFNLYNNYPNPFNPTTQIRYDLPGDARVSITIYDLMGRSIKSLVRSNQTAGYHSVRWDGTSDIGKGVSAGLYFYTIVAGEFRQTKKMLLLK
jgi:hypothetical protein